MITLLVIGVCIGWFCVGLFTAWKVAERKSINYKQRWKEALALLKEEREKTGILEGPEKEKKDTYRITTTRGHYDTFIRLYNDNQLMWQTTVNNYSVDYTERIENAIEEADELKKVYVDKGL